MQGRQASTPSCAVGIGYLDGRRQPGTNQRRFGLGAPHSGEQHVSPPDGHIRYGGADTAAAAALLCVDVSVGCKWGGCRQGERMEGRGGGGRAFCAGRAREECTGNWKICSLARKRQQRWYAPETDVLRRESMRTGSDLPETADFHRSRLRKNRKRKMMEQKISGKVVVIIVVQAPAELRLGSHGEDTITSTK